MAYRSSVPGLTNYSPSYVVLGRPLRLPIDCMYKTRQTELFLTSRGSLFRTKTQMQKAHQLLGSKLDLGKTRQKLFYNFCAFGPMYIEGKQVLVFF